MIKPEELRLNNLVYAKSPEREKWQIHPISIWDLHYLLFPNASDSIPVDMSPIQLTEEILLKCGGIRQKDKYDCNVIKLDNFIFEYGDHFYMSVGNYWAEIKYLHQLQNLYFALTGKELEIKL